MSPWEEAISPAKEVRPVRGRSHPVAGVSMLLCILSVSCDSPTPPPQPTVRVVTGPFSYPAEKLVESYQEFQPTIDLAVETTDGSQGVVDALQQGRGHVGLAQADVVYSAYRQSAPESAPPTELAGIAVLWPSRLYVIVRRDSPLASIADLRGQHVGIGPKGSSAEAFAHNILAAYALSYTDLQPEFQSLSSMPTDVASGHLDAAILPSPLIDVATPLRRIDSLRLLPIHARDVAAYRFTHPFLKPVVVQPSEFTGVVAPVETIGSDGLMICRRDTPDDIIYEITRLLFLALPQLAKSFPPAEAVDLEQASATPIPLHPGAMRYFRERQIFR